MTVRSLALAAALCGCLQSATAFAENTLLEQPYSVAPAALNYHSYYAQEDQAVSPSDQPAPTPAAASNGECDACDTYCESCCEDDCGGCLHCCDLGDPWSLWDHLHPCGSDIHVGGWWQFGYYNKSNGQFNDIPDKFNLQQGWLYIEKEVDTDANDWDWGGRFDVIYGTDAQKTQAFGNNPGSWDYLNGFDHGFYGWALPQAYLDVAAGDWKLTLGHFYTLIGYEVVPAPDNFFYSHSFTFFNSEPFTHTGALVTYTAAEDTEIYAGWTAGWDTGFDQFDDGSNFLGGFSVPVADDVSFAYILTAGDFGWRGQDGYSHSVLLDWTISDKWEYVFQSDVLRVHGTGADTIGINQYLFYTINDCVQLGGRLEWWKADEVIGFDGGGRVMNFTPGTNSYYEATFGVNIKPQANLVMRPEIRHEWFPFADDTETIFAVDLISLW